MKALAFLLNIIGIVICLYIYQSLGAITFIVIGLVPLLTLFSLSGLAHKKFTLVIMVLNLCLSCLGIILLAVVLVTDALQDYPFLPEISLLFIAVFMAMTIFNLLLLKNLKA